MLSTGLAAAPSAAAAKCTGTLYELHLTPRTFNALNAAGIQFLSELAEWSERDLRTLPQCGPAGVAAIRRALKAAGLSLAKRRRRRRKPPYCARALAA